MELVSWKKYSNMNFMYIWIICIKYIFFTVVVYLICLHLYSCFSFVLNVLSIRFVTWFKSYGLWYWDLKKIRTNFKSEKNTHFMEMRPNFKHRKLPGKSRHFEICVSFISVFFSFFFHFISTKKNTDCFTYNKYSNPEFSDFLSFFILRSKMGNITHVKVTSRGRYSIRIWTGNTQAK